MNGDFLKDIPRYIRYDFFMSLIGLLTVYVILTNNNLNLTEEWKNVLLPLSVICTVHGLIEMKRNYDRALEIEKLRAKYEKKKLKSEIKKIKD